MRSDSGQSELGMIKIRL